MEHTAIKVQVIKVSVLTFSKSTMPLSPSELYVTHSKTAQVLDFCERGFKDISFEKLAPGLYQNDNGKKCVKCSTIIYF